MRKFAYAAGLVALTFFAFVVWILFINGKERWVVPPMDITVTDKNGRALVIERGDVSIENHVIKEVLYEVKADGHIVIPPQKAWMHNSMGTPFNWTRITIDPEGFKSCYEEVSLEIAHMVGDLPPRRLQWVFRLAEEGSKGSCEVIWPAL